MYPKLKKALKHILTFLLLSYGSIGLLILLFYLLNTPEAKGWLAGFYRLSILGYYFFILLVLTFILTPLYFNRYVKILLIFPVSLLQLFLIADYFVFKIYRFHIDMLFIKMAISDFKGIGLSPLSSFVSILVVLIIFFVNYKLFKLAERITIPYIKSLMAILLTVFLAGQVIHIWANYYKQQFIEQYTPYFPYYFPTTSHSLMHKIATKHPGWLPKPVEEAGTQLELGRQKQSGLLQYPLKPLQFNDSLTQKPNILIVVLESWRADMIQPEVMPHIDSLAQQVDRYDNHYSSGNVTVSGLFGLMTGLHPTYLSYVQADAYQNQSVLTKSLQQLGYDIKAYTSSNLDRFSLKPIIFGHINDDHYINFMGQRADKNDRKVIDQLKKDILTEPNNPWFKFVFLISSHHHYNYPKSFEKFKPLPTNSEGFIFDKDIDPAPFLNDYKNSLLYEDALVHEVLEALKSSGKLKNTLIFLTGDHAEEFNDNKLAYWGHGSNFTLYQTQVPLLVRRPQAKMVKKTLAPTGHIDVLPTILKDYLGCKNPVSDFSSGLNFNAPAWQSKDSVRGLIQTSYKDKAYLIDSIIYATGLRVQSYRVDDIKAINKKYDYKRINWLRKEEVHFLK